MKREYVSAVVVFVVAVMPSQAGAAPRNPTEAAKAVVECRTIADTAARVACYDAAAAALEEAMAPPSPEEQAADFGSRSSGAQDNDGFSIFGIDLFGSEQLPKSPEERSAEVSEISARVVERATTSAGRTIFMLDNGQMWRTVDSTEVRWPSDEETPMVRVNRGALGSYRLNFAGLNKAYLVRRIK